MKLVFEFHMLQSRLPSKVFLLFPLVF